MGKNRGEGRKGRMHDDRSEDLWFGFLKIQMRRISLDFYSKGWIPYGGVVYLLM
jgi:hypothetical protein